MKTCLVVDDDKLIRMVAVAIVESLGLKAQEAADGQEAIDACMRAMPDAVLLDWKMPVKDGFDFLVELRAMPDGDAPVVIFCTSEYDIDQIQRAVGAGANGYIMKPFDRDIIKSNFSELGLT